MSTNTTEFENWTAALDYKARILYAQIARLQSEVAESGGSDDLLDELAAPYFDLLKSIYAEDYPLAKAVEESDLLVRLEGPAITRDNPRISIIAGELTKVRAQVGKVAKSIAELSSSFRGVPTEMDLGLSAFAKGSLILGFTVPTAPEVAEARDGQESLFGEQDPFFQAARDAIRAIGIVTRHITEDGSPDELSSLIPDPKVRDTALSAVKELSPSGRTGISSVRLSGKSITDFEAKQPLTVKTREAIRKRIERPVRGALEPPVTIIGYVREMDLDNKRFELRHLEGLEDSDVRCVYVNETDEEAKQWLNTRARVTGIVERDPAGKARLLETISVEILSEP
jgi:hypothetical protein